MTWYENLKFLREQKGLSQQEVADNIHIDRSTISHYEAGNRDPKAQIIHKLADFYKVSPNEIFSIEDRGDENIENFIFKASKMIKNEKISKEEKAQAIKRIMDLWISEQREGAIAL